MHLLTSESSPMNTETDAMPRWVDETDGLGWSPRWDAEIDALGWTPHREDHANAAARERKAACWGHP